MNDLSVLRNAPYTEDPDMPSWKLFADRLTDLEDELQRMRAMCERSGDAQAAEAAALAADRLLDLAQLVVERGEAVLLAEPH